MPATESEYTPEGNHERAESSPPIPDLESALRIKRHSTTTAIQDLLVRGDSTAQEVATTAKRPSNRRPGLFDFLPDQDESHVPEKGEQHESSDDRERSPAQPSPQSVDLFGFPVFSGRRTSPSRNGNGNYQRPYPIRGRTSRNEWTLLDFIPTDADTRETPTPIPEARPPPTTAPINPVAKAVHSPDPIIARPESPSRPAPVVFASSERAKARDILAAIRVLKLIEQEQRVATVEEQNTLARFAGFGPVALSIFADPVTGLFKDANWRTRAGLRASRVGLEPHVGVLLQLARRVVR